MSKASVFPDPSDKYRIATSSAMPTTPYPGLMVYQADVGRLVTWNGVEWVQVSGEREAKTLYVGKPGTVFAGATLVDRYRPASGVTAVITNLTISHLTGGGPPLAIILKPNSASGVYLSLFPDIAPYTVLSMDTYMPMSNTDTIGAGISLSNPSDFNSDTTLTITGIEYP